MSIVIRYIGPIWLAFVILALFDTLIRGGAVIFAGLLLLGAFHATLTWLDP